MSPAKLFTVAIVALTGLCNTVEAKQQTVTIDFQGSGVVGALLEADQTPVGTAFPTTVAGDDPMGNAVVLPGVTITTIGSSVDPNAVVNGTTNNGIGINSDVNFFDPPAANEEAAQLDSAFDESLTFTFNQDVTITEVEFFSLSDDPLLAESVSFAGQTLLGVDGAASDVFTFSPGLFIPANDPIVFFEISGNGTALETFTIVVPEPSSLAMLGISGCLMFARRRRC